jgi:hypothetical protein
MIIGNRKPYGGEIKYARVFQGLSIKEIVKEVLKDPDCPDGEIKELLRRTTNEIRN